MALIWSSEHYLVHWWYSLKYNSRPQYMSCLTNYIGKTLRNTMAAQINMNHNNHRCSYMALVPSHDLQERSENLLVQIHILYCWSYINRQCIYYVPLHTVEYVLGAKHMQFLLTQTGRSHFGQWQSDILPHACPNSTPEHYKTRYDIYIYCIFIERETEKEIY